MEGGNDSMKVRLPDQESYKSIKEHIIKKRLLSEKGIDKLKTIYIADYEENPAWEGKNLYEILILLSKKPTISHGADLIIDIQKNGGASCVFFQMIEDDVETLMQLDYNMIASDGSVRTYNEGVPHCRNYGAFPRILHRYVNQRNILTMEEAIRKMTSLPAQVLRLSDRGLIKKGLYADIVIFDPERIRDTATYENPHQYPEGIQYVIVNGTIAALDGKSTGALAGKVLTR
jgi:N-acyl-D-amino-acid deacylase